MIAAIIIAVSILFSAYLIVVQIRESATKVADRLSALNARTERVGDKLDALWGPLESTKNAAWHGKHGALDDE